MDRYVDRYGRYYKKLGEVERELELREIERQERERFEEEIRRVAPLFMLASLPVEGKGPRKEGSRTRFPSAPPSIPLPPWYKTTAAPHGLLWEKFTSPPGSFVTKFGEDPTAFLNLAAFTGDPVIAGTALAIRMGLRAFGIGRKWPNVGINIKLTPKEARVVGIHTKDIGGPGKVSPTAEWYKKFAYSVGSPFAKTAGLLGIQLPELRLSTAAGRKDMDVLSEKAKATTFYNIYNKWAVPIARKVGLNIPEWKTGRKAIGPYSGGRFGSIRYNWRFNKGALRKANKKA